MNNHRLNWCKLPLRRAECGPDKIAKYVALNLKLASQDLKRNILQNYRIEQFHMHAHQQDQQLAEERKYCGLCWQ